MIPLLYQPRFLTRHLKSIIVRFVHVDIRSQHSKLKPNWKIFKQQNRYFCDKLPAHTKVLLPALSPTMDVGTIISWEKNEGDQLSEGDLLAEIETDKTTMGFETPEEGYLAKILIEAGTRDIPVGKLLCIIVEEQSQIEAFRNFIATEETSVKQEQKQEQQKQEQPVEARIEEVPKTITTAPGLPVNKGDRVYASPMAKRIAEQRNIRLQGKGSGVFNSLKSNDIESLVAAAEVAAATATPAAPIKSNLRTESLNNYIDIPLTNMRSVIAKRLTQSKQTIPNFYLNISINIDRLLEMRTRLNHQLKNESDSSQKLSLNDFLIKACSLACLKVPEVNSSWQDTFIRRYKNVDVSVAVSTEHGLITPIIFEANRKGLREISNDMKTLAAKARENKLQLAEFQGGTFSVSNLGMFGIETFTAIVNPPQSCILAIGSIEQRLVFDPDSEKGFKNCNFLSTTLSCDHRVVDGAVGAQWMQCLRSFLEHPETMIL